MHAPSYASSVGLHIVRPLLCRSTVSINNIICFFFWTQLTTHIPPWLLKAAHCKRRGTIPALNEGPPRGNRLPSIFYIHCCLTISTTLWGHHHGATHCRGHVVESHGITRPATISMDVVFRIIWVVYSMNRSPDSRISNWMWGRWIVRLEYLWWLMQQTGPPLLVII